MKKPTLIVLAAFILAASILMWLPSASPIRAFLSGRTSPRLSDGETGAKVLDSGKDTDQSITSAGKGIEGMPPSGASDRSHDASSSMGAPSTPFSQIGSTAVEQSLLHGGNVNVSTAQTLLHSDYFAETVRELRKETVRDSLAVDMTNTIEHAFEKQIKGANSSIQIQDFSCGTTICMGVLRSSDPAQFKSWMQAFLDNKTIPKYVVSDHTIDLGGGSYEDRFMFTTDQNSNKAYDPLIQGH